MKKFNNNNDLERAIDAMDDRRGNDFSKLFGDFLEMGLGLLCNNPSEYQKELLSKTFADEKRKSLFLEALKIYGELAEGYRDPLGDMFMTRISHGNNGQFFTPDAICKLMARLTGVDGGSVNDPCCGSGRTLLAALEEARLSGNEPTIYGNDISYTAAQMCLMNLLFNSARGAVSCGNTLTLKMETFQFFKIDRVLMPNGGWVSTYWRYTYSDLAEVDKMRKEWILKMVAKGLWVELDNESKHNNSNEQKQVKKMTPENFFKMVTKMREAQKDYEMSGNKKSLEKKNVLEKVIDSEIKKYEK